MRAGPRSRRWYTVMYAHASRAQATATVADEMSRIEVRDDGVGGRARTAVEGCSASPTRSPRWAASCAWRVRPAPEPPPPPSRCPSARRESGGGARHRRQVGEPRELVGQLPGGRAIAGRRGQCGPQQRAQATGHLRRVRRRRTRQQPPGECLLKRGGEPEDVGGRPIAGASARSAAAATWASPPTRAADAAAGPTALCPDAGARSGGRAWSAPGLRCAAAADSAGRRPGAAAGPWPPPPVARRRR
jgi:hypothetical protein